MQKDHNHRISLLQGDYFQNNQLSINSFFDAIFDSFSLLSWFSQSYGIQILNVNDINQQLQNYIVYTFKRASSSVQQYLLQFDKNRKERTLKYLLFSSPDQLDNAIAKMDSLECSIRVTISKHKQYSKIDTKTNKTVIYIDIQDNLEFFIASSSPKQYNKISHKKRKAIPHHVQYYYKEPLDRRNKQTSQCHFNLAFQGGGAKGVSYVGVFKALKELHKNTPINSVIGSSAGGILALAISTEMSPDDISELCLRMDTIPKDKYFKNQSEITPEIQQEFDLMIKKIKCILHNYGLVQASLFDQFAESCFDIETGNKILNVLQCINPSIAQLFQLQLTKNNKKQSGLYTHRFNYYGLLKAGLMKGQAVENIACECLVNFFTKHYDEMYMKTHTAHRKRRIILDKIVRKWGFEPTLPFQVIQQIFDSKEFKDKLKTLTLKQYYSINEVQFTCTSVDLNDKILRFFNHKTTPDLPVCKTVQMTGSFPVAFLAQTWKSQWGKYYVHYTYTRKQIDLTGHQFTDGGLLANFPIKYLDNEQMRPMYFSHKKSEQFTILYGFGLDPIDSEDDSEQIQIKTKAIEQLKAHILSKISKVRLLKNLIMSNSQVELEQYELQEIPVIGFALKLMQTFTVSDYNLNMECFQKSIIETIVQERIIDEKKVIKKEINKFTKFHDQLQNLYSLSESKRGIEPKELLKSTCQKLKQRLNQFQTPNNTMIQQVRSQVLQSLYNYQGIRIKHDIAQCAITNQLIKGLQMLYPSQQFKMQITTNIRDQMLASVSAIQDFFLSFGEQQSKQLQFIYSKMLEMQLDLIRNVSGRVQQIVNQLTANQHQTMQNREYQQATSIEYQMVFDLISMQKKFFITDQPYIKEFMKDIVNLELPILSIDKQILDNAISIEAQLNTIVNCSTNDRIHLVFESKQNSNLYYCGLFSILQEILNREENSHKKIEMITCSDFHSVFAFMLAGGKKIVNMRKEMWKVKDLINFDDGIQREYDTLNWAKTQGQQMRELLDLTWNQQYQIFNQLEKYLNAEEKKDLTSQIRNMRTQFQYSKDTVTESMENVLDFVVCSVNEAKKIKDPALRQKKLAQLMSLRNDKQNKNYKDKNKAISKNTQKIISMFMNHFSQLATYVLLNNYLVRETFQKFDANNKQKVWKGALIKRLLSSKRLQLYLKKQLQDMKLNANTTLSQFYQFCPRKITLNFTLINKTKERMQIINRFTKPNMPIWAAIIASTSMPLILPEFNCRDQWEFSPFTDSRMRKLVDYFFNNQDEKQQTVYISGNYVSTLPLELLTNQKIAKQNFTNLKAKEEIFLKNNLFNQSTASDFHAEKTGSSSTQFTNITFSFSKKTKDQKESYLFNNKKKKFLNFSNVLNIIIEALTGTFKNISVGLKDILHKTQILKYLSTRIECHDNTIMKLYADQTIKLPIRLGTLDFYKIEQGKKTILNSCIYEAEFVVRGIFQNLKISADNKYFSYLSRKQTYLQYFTKDDNVHLKFVSRSKWNKKLATMYNIFYRLSQSQTFTKYQEEYITFPTNKKTIYFKFVYPNMTKMLMQQQQIEVDFRQIKQNDDNLIFRFNFQEVGRKVVKGVDLFQQKLKTRVIPRSKPDISEHHIEDSAVQLIKNKYINQINNQPSELQEQSAVLIIKTIINFKHNGLYCNDCVSKLSRVSQQSKNTLNSVKLSKCYKCKQQHSIIGYECSKDNCSIKDKSKYCFQCLLVYLISKSNGSYHCTTEHHQFDYCSSMESTQIILCHFCGSAATSYYRDDACNINICFKCSLILDSKRTVDL